jgi:hypothetical protein
MAVLMRAFVQEGLSDGAEWATVHGIDCWFSGGVRSFPSVPERTSFVGLISRTWPPRGVPPMRFQAGWDPLIVRTRWRSSGRRDVRYPGRVKVDLVDSRGSVPGPLCGTPARDLVDAAAGRLSGLLRAERPS